MISHEGPEFSIGLVLLLLVAVLVLALIFAFLAWDNQKNVRPAAEERNRALQASRQALLQSDCRKRELIEKHEQHSRVLKERRARVASLGPEYAAAVESALAAVEQISASEAARTGWLGDDFDFTGDIRAITNALKQAHALRQTADGLSALDKPSSADLEILTEAKTSISNLEVAAHKRVKLLRRCARKARLIDESLHEERKDALTAQQRAELHGKLRGMLYGVEATPDTAPTSAAADAVMARAFAYRAIKEQIKNARGG